MTRDAEHTRVELTAALTDVDDARADRIVRRATVELGALPTLRDVLGGAMCDIGELWECGAIGTADEQAATRIVTRAVETVRSTSRRAAPTPPPRALVCVAPGERHALPAQLFSAMLEASGWEVRTLSVGDPASHVQATARSWNPAICAVSLTTREFVEPTSELVRRLTADGFDVHVGGTALGEPDVVTRLMTAGATTHVDARSLLDPPPHG